MLGKLHIKGRKRVPINIRKRTLCLRGTAQLLVDPGLPNLNLYVFICGDLKTPMYSASIEKEGKILHFHFYAC
jgi:hypothetical protein